ncbi:hypothetical protein CHELA41_24493 [Hyphomicrobiales bacterium]|nr:hypothetical protein CHELA41_24493 [Hyphomicrobiales bacterium]
MSGAEATSTFAEPTILLSKIKNFIEERSPLAEQKKLFRSRFVTERSWHDVPPPGPRTSRPPSDQDGIDRAIACAWLRCVSDVSRVHPWGDDWEDDRRGKTIGCKLLGLPWAFVDKARTDAVDYGAAGAAIYWAPYMRGPDDRYIGHMYLAEVRGDAEKVKVGFSRKPQKRMKTLSRQLGNDVRMIWSIPATMLHEWAFHQIVPPYDLPNEWYYRRILPDWFLNAPKEHSNV